MVTVSVQLAFGHRFVAVIRVSVFLSKPNKVPKCQRMPTVAVELNSKIQLSPSLLSYHRQERVA